MGRNVACHVWTKEKEEKKSSVATYLKINSLYFYFSCYINNTMTALCVLFKETAKKLGNLVMIRSSISPG